MGIGKVFINSMVSQIGRDTGKVITNSVYGDAHATPIRRVGSEVFRNNGDPITYEEALNVIKTEGYEKDLKLLHPIWFFLLTILLFFLPVFVPQAILVISGILKLFRKDTVFFKKERVAKYVPDRRYRSGARLAGYSDERIELKMPASNDDKKKYRIRGFIYIMIGLAILAFHTYICFFMPETQTNI